MALPLALGPTTALTGLILAGGAGRRMHGRDKGLLCWRGQPLVAWVARGLPPQVTELLISANRNQATYATYADRVIGDAEPDYPGPLAGLLAGLAAAHRPWLLCVPCDLPRLSPEVYRHLLQQGQITQRPVLAQIGTQIQPTVSLLPVTVQPDLQAQWHRGERSLKRALACLAPVYADCSAWPLALRNYNTPDDLETG